MVSSTYKPIRGPEYRSKEYWCSRVTTFGASEASMALGVSLRGQPRDLYEQKIALQQYLDEHDGEPPDIDSVMTFEQARGHILEGPVLDLYAQEKRHRSVHGALWKTPPNMIHPETPFTTCTPDGLWKDGGEGSRINWHTAWPGCRPLDSKTWAGRRDAFGEPGTDEVPADILCQAQQHNYVCGSDSCDIPVLFGMNLSVYTIARNDELIAMIVKAEKELHQRIVNREPPPIKFDHPKALELVKSLTKDVDDSQVELTDNQTAMVLAWEELKKRRLALENAIDALSAEIRMDLGSSCRASLAGDSEGRFLERKFITRSSFSVDEASYVDMRIKKPRKKK